VADTQQHTPASAPLASPVFAAPSRGGFWLEITTVEDFAAFMRILAERAFSASALADFAVMKARPSTAAVAHGFYLAFSTLHDFTAFLGIVRGEILDVASLAEVSTQLANARARLQASLDREGGTPASPAAGPPRPPVHRPRSLTSDQPLGVDATMEAQAIIDNAVAEAALDVTVMGGASTVIDGIDAAIAAAVVKAQAGGATAAQIAPFIDVQTSLQGAREQLATAIAARTPGAPTTDTPASAKAPKK
jgi:hypothetical protein